MSRVERKRLEKEAKKKNRFFFGKKSGDNKINTGNLPDNKINTANIDNKNLENRSSKNNIDELNKVKSVEKSDGFYAKEIEKMKNTSNYKAVKNESEFGADTKNMAEFYSDSTVRKNKMMTADRIISVEDERMRFERKQRSASNASDTGKKILTADDIFTVEDIENGVLEIDEAVDSNSSEEIEQNINEIKKLNIERAPFEDEVKVAESRLASELENTKKKDLNNSDKLVDEKEVDKVEVADKVEKTDIADEVVKNDIPKEIVKSAETKKIVKESEGKQENMNIVSNNEVDKKGGFKSSMKKFFGIVVLILIVVYGIGCVIFNGRFFANTEVNGIDVSFKTPSELDELAAKKIDGYKLVLNGRNGVKDSISGEDIDLKYTKDGSAEKIKEAQGFLGWPIAFYKGETIDGKLNIGFDQDKLDNVMETFNIFKKENIKEPISAFPDYDNKAKKMIVNKGDLGSTPIKKNVSSFIKNTLLAEKTEVNYSDSVYKPQNNTASNPNIKKAIETIEPYTKLKIVYDFDDKKYTATGQDIVKMFNVDSEGDYKVELSKDNVREFVRMLSRKYSTYGDPREIMSASTGEKLKVTGGVYGWLIDREKETDELYKLLGEKKDIVDRKPIYAQTAISRENNDMGNEFIEIDLSKQHMWFVKDNKPILESPIVSGKPSAGSATPTGIYPLNYKTRNATLRGPGYSSPVSYWMPFNGDIGIHDANWQPYFGGARYLYGGSHGCINTPYYKVAEFYSLAKEGMPIVVHH